MGESTGSKKRGSESLSQPLASFPPPSGSESGKAAARSETEKMALPEAVENGNQTDPVTRTKLRADLASSTKLETTMLEKFKALMDPLWAQLQEMQQNLSQLMQTADTAMELGLNNQETSRQLKRDCNWAMEKIMLLENQLKADNLKLCGFPEGCEENMENLGSRFLMAGLSPL